MKLSTTSRTLSLAIAADGGWYVRSGRTRCLRFPGSRQCDDEFAALILACTVSHGRAAMRLNQIARTSVEMVSAGCLTPRSCPEAESSCTDAAGVASVDAAVILRLAISPGELPAV